VSSPSTALTVPPLPSQGSPSRLPLVAHEYLFNWRRRRSRAKVFKYLNMGKIMFHLRLTLLITLMKTRARGEI
jgi:predicted metalloprotease with PDZ domain